MDELLILLAVFDDTAYDMVYQQLLNSGFCSEQLMNSKNIGEKLTISFLEKNMEKYRKVYSMLGDEASKEVYLNRIKRAYLEQDISHIVSNARDIYFDEQIRLTEEEVFVDCGGYIGDTALQFINKSKGRYKKLIII